MRRLRGSIDVGPNGKRSHDRNQVEEQRNIPDEWIRSLSTEVNFKVRPKHLYAKPHAPGGYHQQPEKSHPTVRRLYVEAADYQ
jgi:hypothetical protein